MTNPDILPRRSVLAYAVLSLPLAFAGLPLYIHAPDFYATEYQVSLVSLAMLLLVIRLFDAVQDPLLGRLSDRVGPQRIGGLMAVAMLCMVLAFTGLFLPAPWGIAPLAWFGGCMLLATTAFSFISINFQALGGVWSSQPRQQTRIATYREAINLLGLLLAVALPGLLQQSMAMPKTTAFMVMAVLLAVLLGTGGIIFLRWLRHSFLSAQRESGPIAPATGVSWWVVRGHGRFFALYGVSALASAIPAVLILFYVRDYLRAEAWTGLFLALYFLSAAAAMPLWQLTGNRWGAAKAWLAAMLLAVASFGWVYALQPGEVIAYGVICVLSGAAFGAELALPAAILAGRIRVSGQVAQAASLYAALIFLGKFTLAIASGGALFALGVAGFEPAQGAGAGTEVLRVVYGLVPCAIKLLAAAGLLHAIHQHYFAGESHVAYVDSNGNREPDHA
jgi:glycoside/pentoside/hexuronide:cation symporter, GPH family